MEALGIPSAVLITEPFIPTAKEIARIKGLPDFQFVILKHPLGSLNDDELRERAREAVPQIEKIVCR